MDLRPLAIQIIHQKRRGRIPVIVLSSLDREPNLQPTYYDDPVEVVSLILSYPDDAIVAIGSDTITLDFGGYWESFTILHRYNEILDLLQ